METLITPIEIDGRIGLQIPRSAECLGMREFFLHILGRRDEFYGEKQERLIEEKNHTIVKFTLNELAESTFGNYAPSDFAKELRLKLNPNTKRSQELYNIIEDFELAHRTIYFGWSHSRKGLTWYFCPVNPDEILTYDNLHIPQKYRSKTKSTENKIYVPRAPDLLIGNCPANLGYIFHLEKNKRTLRDGISDSPNPATLYLCEALGELNLDPFYLIKKFDVDTSGFKIINL